MMKENEVTPKKKSAFSRFVKKYPVLTTVLIGILVAVCVYFWKDIEGNIEKKAVIKMANAELIQNNRESLTVLSKPLAWSIRSEMMKGNMDQVDLLITDLVKEKNFQFVHIVGIDGNVILSTNKKIEGQAVDLESVRSILPADSTMVIDEPDSVIVVVTPVMGYDSKLGTLVFGYKYQIPAFD